MNVRRISCALLLFVALSGLSRCRCETSDVSDLRPDCGGRYGLTGLFAGSKPNEFFVLGNLPGTASKVIYKGDIRGNTVVPIGDGSYDIWLRHTCFIDVGGFLYARVSLPGERNGRICRINLVNGKMEDLASIDRGIDGVCPSPCDGRMAGLVGAKNRVLLAIFRQDYPDGGTILTGVVPGQPGIIGAWGHSPWMAWSRDAQWIAFPGSIAAYYWMERVPEQCAGVALSSTAAEAPGVSLGSTCVKETRLVSDAGTIVLCRLKDGLAIPLFCGGASVLENDGLFFGADDCLYYCTSTVDHSIFYPLQWEGPTRITGFVWKKFSPETLASADVVAINVRQITGKDSIEGLKTNVFTFPSPDFSRIVSVHYSQRVSYKLFSVEGGAAKEMATLKYGTATVADYQFINSVAWLPDSSAFVTNGGEFLTVYDRDGNIQKEISPPKPSTAPTAGGL